MSRAEHVNQLIKQEDCKIIKKKQQQQQLKGMQVMEHVLINIFYHIIV